MADLAKMPTKEELGLGYKVGQQTRDLGALGLARGTSAARTFAGDVPAVARDVATPGAVALDIATMPVRGILTGGSNIIAGATGAPASSQQQFKAFPLTSRLLNGPAPVPIPGQLGPAAPFAATGMTRSPATQAPPPAGPGYTPPIVPRGEAAPIAVMTSASSMTPAASRVSPTQGIRSSAPGGLVMGPAGTNEWLRNNPGANPMDAPGMSGGVAQTELIRNAAGKIVGERPTGRMISFGVDAPYAGPLPPSPSETMPSMRSGGLNMRGGQLVEEGGAAPRMTTGLQFGEGGKIEPFARPMSANELDEAAGKQATARLAGTQADYFGPTAELGMKKTAAEIAEIAKNAESERAYRAAQAAAAPVAAEAKTTAAEAAATKAEAAAPGTGKEKIVTVKGDLLQGTPDKTMIFNDKTASYDDTFDLEHPQSQAAKLTALEAGLGPQTLAAVRAKRAKGTPASVYRDMLVYAKQDKNSRK